MGYFGQQDLSKSAFDLAESVKKGYFSMFDLLEQLKFIYFCSEQRYK